MKLFGGPGEPEASLGEPRVRKSFLMTLLPFPFGYFPYSFSKRRKTFWIVRQLVSSSSIWLAIIKMLENDSLQMKLGYDTYDLGLGLWFEALDFDDVNR